MVAVDTTRARMGAPSFRASPSSISSTPEEASFMPEELPAVTLPPSRKAGFSFASFSRVVSRLGYSSVAITPSPWRAGTVTGTISSRNFPASMAAAARRWDWRAYWSMSSRLTP